MSSGFSDEQRAEIRKKLISVGVELAAQIGFKKMTVALVARSAGVATGTFYNFFDSKESFVCAMIKDMGEMNFVELSCYIERGVTIGDFLAHLREFFRPENNFMLRIGLEDWVWLKTHITDSRFFNDPSDMSRIGELVSRIEGVRSDADMGVAANFIKTVYAMYQNKETFYEYALQTNVDLIFDAVYRYIKEEQ
ncbi:MAG: TetR/AcrR family transcriptional regulator [Oscillospiraceae bacterium]|nr:TetR/AcrR family transcriptional regulator [Oscillospiraceae bacterium]